MSTTRTSSRPRASPWSLWTSTPVRQPRCRGRTRTPTRGPRSRLPGSGVLAFRENGNKGWGAAQDGRRADRGPRQRLAAGLAPRRGRERAGHRDLHAGAAVPLRPGRRHPSPWSACWRSCCSGVRRPPTSTAAPVGDPLCARQEIWVVLTTVSLGLIAGWAGAVPRRWRLPVVVRRWRGTGGRLVLDGRVSSSWRRPSTTRSTDGARRTAGRGSRLLPQLAVLLAVVLAVSSAAGRPSRRSRIAGTSTKR